MKTDLQKVEEAFKIIGMNFDVYGWIDYDDDNDKVIGTCIGYGDYHYDCCCFDNEAHFDLNDKFVETIQLN